MMDLYFLILAFCLVPAYSYESFIKTANGPNNITCDQNSFIITNHSGYRECNEKQTCSLNKPGEKVFYVCLKSKFKRSSCTELKHYINQTGCYAGKVGGNYFKIGLAKNSTKYFHFFVLYMALFIYDQSPIWISCPVFSYYKCKDPCRILLDGHPWFLLKVSDKSEEDFGEFFMEKNSGTTFMGKEEDTRYPVTCPTNSCLSVNKVNIILGAVVIILLIVFMQAALAFYRKKLQNAKRTPNTETTNAMYEIPLSESVYDVIN